MTDPAAEEIEREEIVDAELPVVAEARPIERAAPAQLPAVQVAAVAATGFVAGAVTAVAVKARHARRPARRRKRKGRGQDLIEVVSSRSFLVDVHLINKS